MLSDSVSQLEDLVWGVGGASCVSGHEGVTGAMGPALMYAGMEGLKPG